MDHQIPERASQQCNCKEEIGSDWISADLDVDQFQGIQVLDQANHRRMSLFDIAVFVALVVLIIVHSQAEATVSSPTPFDDLLDVRILLTFFADPMGGLASDDEDGVAVAA